MAKAKLQQIKLSAEPVPVAPETALPLVVTVCLATQGELSPYVRLQAAAGKWVDVDGEKEFRRAKARADQISIEAGSALEELVAGFVNAVLVEFGARDPFRGAVEAQPAVKAKAPEA